MNYPKATCDPGTEALRMANERADRWKQRHDALATRLASVEALHGQLVDRAMELDAQGDFTSEVYASVATRLGAALGSDAHTEQKGTGE